MYIAEMLRPVEERLAEATRLYVVPLHHEESLPLEYQVLQNDPDWEYVAFGPIKEEEVWLGVKKDQNGNPLRSIMGSVVGRVRQPETIIHPGNVKEDMVRLSIYARWDPKNPNPDLLELGKLTRGATGIEVKIERVVQPIVANAKGVEYTGIRKRRVVPAVVEKPQNIVREHVA